MYLDTSTAVKWTCPNFRKNVDSLIFRVIMAALTPASDDLKMATSTCIGRWTGTIFVYKKLDPEENNLGKL